MAKLTKTQQIQVELDKRTGNQYHARYRPSDGWYMVDNKPRYKDDHGVFIGFTFDDAKRHVEQMNTPVSKPSPLRIEFKLLPYGKLPSKAFLADAGWDLYASVSETIKPGTRVMFRTGVCMNIPSGYCGVIMERPNMAAQDGLVVLGGMVNSGERAEILVRLFNTSDKDVFIGRGSKIAHLLIMPVPNVEWVRVSELGEMP